MQLPNSVGSIVEFTARLPQQKIAKAISVIVAIYIAYLLAQLTWILIPEQNVNNSQVASNASKYKVSEKNIDVSGLLALNLFGVFDNQIAKPQEETIQDAPETRLNLTLAGVVASDDASTAAAVIENNGSQETYGIGDKISGTRATLQQVMSDRIIIKQSGKVETLMLDGFDYKKVNANNTLVKPATPKAQNRTKRQTVDQRNNAALATTVKALKNDLADDPAKLTDYLKISPKRESGKVVGYRLMPGKSPEFFTSAGLKVGDVAVFMNGLDLTVPAEAAQALKALKEETNLSLLVKRNDDLTEILFSVQ